MANDLTVVVDERERQSGIIESFERHDDVDEVFVEMLEVGDVVVEGEVVFERKTPGDFVGSIQNRRLETQIKSMYDMFDTENSYVIIEGNMEDFDRLTYTNFSSKSARGYVGSLCARWGCVPLFASDQSRLVDTVTRVSRKHFEKTKRVVREPQDSPSSANDDFFARTILQLDGVGRSKIDPLRERYSSVSQLAEAQPVDLKTIEGIGGKTANKIVDQIQGNA